MILSMTGFAAASADLPTGTLGLEIRTVNHRYLELALRIPDELRALEPAIRDRIGGVVKRGKVDCRVAFNRGPTRAQSIAVDPALVDAIRAAADAVRQRVPDCAPLTAAEILRWPGVLAEPEVSPQDMAATVDSLVATALADLGATRAREGAKLAQVIDACCQGVLSQIERVAPRIPAIQAAYMEKLAQRIREAGAAPDDDRLKQELALYATRIDVAEEVARLTTHVAEVRRVLSTGGSNGKRLDFLMQELNREANTLGSKSADVELTRVAVELKVLIEQMREQVQNIE